MLGVRKYESSNWSYHLRMLFPLAFAKFLSSVLTRVSVWKVPVHYAHTVKVHLKYSYVTIVTTEIFLDFSGLNATFHCAAYQSLLWCEAWLVGLPLSITHSNGVAIATVTELSFDIIGLWSALLATGGFAIITVFSKKALKDTGMHHLRLLYMLGLMAAVMFLPVWLVVSFFQFYGV